MPLILYFSPLIVLLSLQYYYRRNGNLVSPPSITTSRYTIYALMWARQSCKRIVTKKFCKHYVKTMADCISRELKYSMKKEGPLPEMPWTMLLRLIIHA